MTQLYEIAPWAFWRVTPPDLDPVETREWLEAFDALVEAEGADRATFLLKRLLDRARAKRVKLPPVFNTAYKNTIALEDQPQFPGNLEVEQRLASIIRWNALAMVVRANREHAELGGHIASYASAADLFEVGFNHFFRAGGTGEGKGSPGTRSGDLVYFQPHSAPGVYARAFLEGRLSEEQLEHYRREVGGAGLSSYCHPWLMPDFWQFPTGSMGLGPINAIYQARFMRYLENRGILATAGRKVWAFVGDGEMDEPESLAALSLAAREGLDNLIFVVNCNLQRLDGPVRGNGSVVQELEGLFAGAGWNVVKLMWGSDWDPLFARDNDGVILKRLHETVDGEFQTYAATDGRFNREHFFNKYPELKAIIAHMSDEDIDRLRRGGHDPVKIYAAYRAAVAHQGQPTVILAKTKKGYGMGHWGQGKMGTHQQKKLDDDALKDFRDRFALPLSDDDVVSLRLYKPADDAPEMKYLHARRQALGGFLPARSSQAPELAVPQDAFARMLEGTRDREQSTTMVFVQLLAQLLRDPALGKHVVPIVADEARTFGMQSLFRQIGIYSSSGQLYEPEDHDELLVLQGGQGRPDPRGGHHRSGRVELLDRGGDELQLARRADAAVLHLLLDVRLPARRRPRVGGGRFARARISAGCDGRPHHALGRGAAAPGRHEPPHRLDDPELPRLRPVLRLRARADRAGRHAPDARSAGGRLLLRDRDERELRASGDAGGRRRRCSQGHVPAPAAGGRASPAPRQRHDPARGDRGCRDARARARHRGERLERHELDRAALGRHGMRARPPARGRDGRRRGSSARSPRPSGRSLPRATTSARWPISPGRTFPPAGRTPRSARTASGAATRAPRCAPSSRSTGMRS